MTRTRLLQILPGTFIGLFSSVAMAHPGHGDASLESSALHFLFEPMHVAQFAMFAVITLAAWKVASRLIGQNSRLQRSQQRIDG